MNLRFSVWFMILASFVIQFVFMSLLMTDSVANVTFSLGKFYLSCIMGLIMGLLEVIMYDYHHGIVSLYYYLSIVFVMICFIYVYRNQMYIDDKEYLKEMIEHHSMALLTSEEILQKTSSERVKKLAETIVETQQKEIDYMRDLIKYDR